MTELEVGTYQDAVDHLVDVFEVDRRDVLIRRARRAVKNAYKRLARLEHWSYYERRTQIQTVPAITAGSLAYEHTGGAFERLVTLAGATVPQDVRFYDLIIGQDRYKVEEFKTASTFTLAQDTNPGVDLAAGTSYALARSTYPLPIDFRRLISRPLDLASSYRLEPVDVSHKLELEVTQQQPQQPYWFTLRNAGEFYGGICLEFSPPPDTRRTYDLYYEALPRPLLTYRDTGGTVGIVGGTDVLNLAGGSFKPRHVGAIVRLSNTATVPTGVVGDEDFDNPYAVQRVILGLNSVTQARLDAVVDDTFSGVGYTISDPLDFESEAMQDLFDRLCEVAFERVSRMPKEEWITGEADIRRALIEAQIADNRMRESRGDEPWPMDVFEMDVNLIL